MSGSSYYNGVVEKKQTLLGIMRSMLSNSNLPKSLWTEALRQHYTY
jgi:hypothetical protein